MLPTQPQDSREVTCGGQPGQGPTAASHTPTGTYPNKRQQEMQHGIKKQAPMQSHVRACTRCSSAGATSPAAVPVIIRAHSSPARFSQNPRPGGNAPNAHCRASSPTCALVGCGMCGGCGAGWPCPCGGWCAAAAAAAAAMPSATRVASASTRLMRATRPDRYLSCSLHPSEGEVGVLCRTRAHRSPGLSAHAVVSNAAKACYSSSSRCPIRPVSDSTCRPSPPAAGPLAPVRQNLTIPPVQVTEPPPSQRVLEFRCPPHPTPPHLQRVVRLTQLPQQQHALLRVVLALRQPLLEQLRTGGRYQSEGQPRDAKLQRVCQTYVSLSCWANPPMPMPLNFLVTAPLFTNHYSSPIVRASAADPRQGGPASGPQWTSPPPAISPAPQSRSPAQ